MHGESRSCALGAPYVFYREHTCITIFVHRSCAPAGRVATDGCNKLTAISTSVDDEFRHFKHADGALRARFAELFLAQIAGTTKCADERALMLVYFAAVVTKKLCPVAYDEGSRFGGNGERLERARGFWVPHRKIT